MVAATIVALLLVSPALAEELLVAAASDLASAERTLSAAFGKETGITVRFVFHSSGMLARQVQNGAPYDVYLSANEKYVEDLVRSGDLVQDTVTVYAIGRLGLWSLDGSVRGISDLFGEDVRHIAVANPAHAPYGVAAKAALLHQGAWSKLKDKIVLGENVRQTYQYGRSGNADAIVTSWTLVHQEGGILLPGEWHDPIRQAGGVLRRSKSPAAGRRFLRFLVGEKGRRALRQHGLFPVAE